MLKSTPQFDQIISLAVMLLMVIALIAAQADESLVELAQADAHAPAVQSDTSHFRLEDE